MNEYLKQLLAGTQVPLRPEESEQMMQQASQSTDMNQMVQQEEMEAEDEMLEESPQPSMITPQPLVAPPTPQIAPESVPIMNPREAMLNQLRELREGNKASLEAARASDAKVDLMSNLNKAFAGTGAAIANRAGITDIKADPLAVKGQSEERTAADNKSDMTALMEEYKALNQQEQQQYERDYKNQMLELQKEKLALQDKKLSVEKARPETFEEKEEIKENVKMRVENRKVKREVEKDIKSTEAVLKKLEDAKKEFEDYSKNSIGGTGPFATLLGLTGEFMTDSQALKSTIKSLNLDEMVKMFAGMSKAVDSREDRAAFEAAQPSLTNDDSVNAQIFKRKIDAVKSMLAKQKAVAQGIDEKGNFIESEQPEQVEDQQVVKKQYNKKLNKTRLIYADGSMEEVDGRQ